MSKKNKSTDKYTNNEVVIKENNIHHVPHPLFRETKPITGTEMSSVVWINFNDYKPQFKPRSTMPNEKVQKGEKLFEIWMEGYSITGNSSGAMLLAKISAKTWDEAVLKYRDFYKKDVDVRTDDNGNKIYSSWACRFFDNEQDARKSFG